MARLVLQESKDLSRRYQWLWNGQNGCEIDEGSYMFIVDLGRQTCTCILWQLRGIPCWHV
ncbi:hypothetical protein HAX54_007308, partial [Datura stramonium]|nr:hypothetical protein [Datura stramonium]